MEIEQIYVAVGVLVFTFVFFFLIRLFKRSKYDTIVLAGLSGSGTTVLFCQLRDGSEPGRKIVTSMDPNDGNFVLPSEFSKIRPVPKLDEYLPQAAGLIFVYLYEILTNALVVKKKVPALIMCNKSDKKNADTKEFIWKQLGKEIDNMHSVWLARLALKFSQCRNKVSVGESSGLTGKISQVELFIREHAY
ncbi:hypothetical protein MKX03_035534 [Papaver bracteatum]|nr:hypothetical protein MKX03_035534 [Papaver bracteatum]